MKTKRTINQRVLNSAKNYPAHIEGTAAPITGAPMRAMEFRWLPGIDGDGGRLQPRGEFRDGAV